MKYSAAELAQAGFKYIGYAYSKMDCQKFVETCMHDVGYVRDLAGSNAWYRAMDWVGSPEECTRQFGSVPKGAILFIVEKDGKEPAKYQGDEKGNASHMGIVTGQGEGAIHSSSSKGCVCESKFKGKTIHNGGWNKVGLQKCFDYGNTVNWHFDHGSGGEPMNETEIGTVYAENGKPVNLRKSPSTSAALIDHIPVGTELEILSDDGDWCKVEVNGKTGWMMKKFIITEDLPVAEDPDQDEDFGSDDLYDEIGENEAAQLLAEIYVELGRLRDKIEKVVGRG
jgi:hypothetical protein